MTGVIKTLDGAYVYEDRWLRIRKDTIERPSGALGSYSVLEKPDFVVIAAIQNDYIYLVEQYRYPVSQRYWEMPQGTWEENGPIPPEKIAVRELKQETGLIAQSIQKVGFFFTAYGYSNQGCHVYLATDLQHGHQELEAEEEDLITDRFSLSDFASMISVGQIKDATTIAAFGMLKLNNLI